MEYQVIAIHDEVWNAEILATTNDLLIAEKMLSNMVSLMPDVHIAIYDKGNAEFRDYTW